ncbi:MAG: A24 family peptidase C-terminal domain-containing protein [Candidatus Thermoplasmatota archaeon]|nr:A24 family peptidase C-terminal domain-containing protein [Candidatus Thermoplasmatota archaeon]
MALTSEQVLGWSRVGVLLLGMGWAAWMDHKERRVSNDHWVVWVKPAIFLWCLELLAREADWTIFLTASAVVAYASVAVIGRPTVKDILAGNREDVMVSLWYLISLVGVIVGMAKYSNVDSLDIVLGKVTGMAGLYWSTLFGLVIIFVIDMSWRLRLIHGGADAKALMWVAILIPNWSTMPVITDYDTEIVLQLPPAISLLMWGGLSFLLIPIILMGKNIFYGNVKSLSDIRMFWHSTVMSIDKVQDSHVWLLTSVIEMPNGESKPYHKTRAPRRTPTDQQLAEQIEQLRLHDINEVWVSYKLPLLVFLFPAILPMALLGDVTPMVMNIIGL